MKRLAPLGWLLVGVLLTVGAFYIYNLGIQHGARAVIEQYLSGPRAQQQRDHA